MLCDEPNHPDHPNSPHCVEHYAQARADSVAGSRERDRQAEDLMRVLDDPTEHTFVEVSYAGPRGIAMLPGKATEIREQYGRLLAAVELARVNTHDLAGRSTTSPDVEWALTQLRDVAAAVRDLNEALAPVLYRAVRQDRQD